SSRGIAAVVGVGPRLGSAVARKFASEGYTIAILSRDLEKLSQLAEEIAQEAKAQVFALRVDCADARSVREAFEGVLSLGPVEVLVYNADDDDAAPHAVPRRHARRLPPLPRRLRRRGLPLRATGHPGHGGAGQGHHHLHGLLVVGHRLRRLLRSKLRQICPSGFVPVAGEGVPAGRRAHCACDHRRRHRREEVAEEQQGRRRWRPSGGGRGPGRGGAELLARPRPGQERMDAGDGHPAAVLHVAYIAATNDGRPI
ncbi:unnamed protein product, partial [Urochloa humidicola]